MGIKFKSPGDHGWNPYGKRHQVHLSGWGCLIYPIIILVITLLSVLTNGWFLLIIPTILVFMFLYGLYSVFTDSDPWNLLD